MRQYMSAMAVLCLFLILGCAKFKDESTNDESKTVTQSGERVTAQNLSDFVKIEVQPTTKPEKYMVYFGWPKMSEAVRVRIRMEQVLTVVNADQTTFSHEVNHNQTLTYTFDVLSANNLIERTFSKLVKVPRDFVVRDGQNQFTENTKLNIQRLFLSSTPLTTNGYDVEIVTNELISDKGIIQTFPEGAKAFASTDGASGGNIVIKAKSAAGQMKAYMRGQNGGDGLKGEAYSSRAADGAPPGAGTVECSCIRCPLNTFMKLIEQADTQPMACFCDSTGSDGGNGAGGAKGRQGGRAGNGGDTGTLKVEISDGSAFLIQTESKIGFAGNPGEGGDGQPGGVALGSKTRCSGRVGSNGPTGPKGDVGFSGNDGKTGGVCIYIASEGKNDCY